jgi:hypothetical protein
VSNKFPKCHIIILLEELNVKIGRRDISKLTILGKIISEISNDNGIRKANFATSKNFSFRSTMIPSLNLHKYTWKTPEGKFKINLTIF